MKDLELAGAFYLIKSMNCQLSPQSIDVVLHTVGKIIYLEFEFEKVTKIDYIAIHIQNHTCN